MTDPADQEQARGAFARSLEDESDANSITADMASQWKMAFDPAARREALEELGRGPGGLQLVPGVVVPPDSE
jgi:hypothetical protein